jgi:hypothetical protein
MSDNDQGPKWHALYFQPSQIVFHLTGEEAQASSTKLLEWANEVAKMQELQISMTPRRIQTFPRLPTGKEKKSETIPAAENARGRESHSLVYADVRLSDGNPLDPNEEDHLEQLLDLIFLLDERRKEIPELPIQVVSPNWLTSGSPLPGGTGGPGGRPAPYSGAPDYQDFKFFFDKPRFAKLKTMQEFLDRVESGTGEGVTVVILDTAPEEDELQAIFDEWVIKDNRNHSLLRSLLKSDRRMLTLHPDPRVNLPPLRDLQCIDYDYDMNDHGLFVAGIIHSLAEQAQIHLYQVLNRYGVGDLEIIGDALEDIIDEFGDGEKMPLVVNLSLNFNIPLERGHTRAGRPDVSDRIGLRILEYSLQPGDQPWSNRLSGLLAPFGDLLDVLGPGIIAAAGNDYDAKRHGNQRPYARYPAAFGHVVGVGALPKSAPAVAGGTPTASYSNLADRPPKTGITTLGGEEGEGNGLLGIYIGKFPQTDDYPDGPPNTSGWAWWCGTSFATPIITGMLAATISSLMANGTTATPPAMIQEAITLIRDAQDHLTGAGEDVLFVRQGPP